MENSLLVIFGIGNILPILLDWPYTILEALPNLLIVIFLLLLLLIIWELSELHSTLLPWAVVINTVWSLFSTNHWGDKDNCGSPGRDLKKLSACFFTQLSVLNLLVKLLFWEITPWAETFKYKLLLKARVGQSDSMDSTSVSSSLIFKVIKDPSLVSIKIV